mgnify:CR=1 FL=1
MTKCEICGKEFESGNAYAGHKTAVHSKVECAVCKKLVASCGYKKHLKFHDRILTAICENKKCNKEFLKGYEKQRFCGTHCANSFKIRKHREIRCSDCGSLIDYQKLLRVKWQSLCKECILKKFFTDNTSCRQNILRRYIILFNLKEEKCIKCNTLNEWQGFPLTLHLHHIDGNRRNNRLENLGFLCLNCHSQTDNYGFKGKHHSEESILKGLETKRCKLKLLRDRQEVKALAS